MSSECEESNGMTKALQDCCNVDNYSERAKCVMKLSDHVTDARKVTDNDAPTFDGVHDGEAIIYRPASVEEDFKESSAA